MKNQKDQNESRVDSTSRAAGPQGSTASGIWAVRALLQRVPDDIPCPEVLVESDGMIGFDWHATVHCTISMHVDDHGKAGWAALIGDYKAHGTLDLTLGLPSQQLDEAFRLYAAFSAGLPVPDAETKDLQEKITALEKAIEAYRLADAMGNRQLEAAEQQIDALKKLLLEIRRSPEARYWRGAIDKVLAGSPAPHKEKP